MDKQTAVNLGVVLDGISYRVQNYSSRNGVPIFYISGMDPERFSIPQRYPLGVESLKISMELIAPLSEWSRETGEAIRLAEKKAAIERWRASWRVYEAFKFGYPYGWKNDRPPSMPSY